MFKYCEDTEALPLGPIRGPSQELISQEAINHFPDNTLLPKTNRSLPNAPTPRVRSHGLPLHSPPVSEESIFRAMNC